jgi:hypothetical protein
VWETPTLFAVVSFDSTPDPSPVSLHSYRLHGDKKDSETGYKKTADIPTVKAEKKGRRLDPKKTIAEKHGLLQKLYPSTAVVIYTVYKV